MQQHNNTDSEFDPDSFYPYRLQQSNPPSPSIDFPEEPPRKSWIPVFLVVAFGFLMLVAYLKIARSTPSIGTTPTPTIMPSPTVTPTFTPTPTQKISRFQDPLLQTAYDQTITAGTLRVVFTSDVITTTTVPTSGAEQKVQSSAIGYIIGYTDGTTMQTELQISLAGNASQTALFGQILVGDQLYIKTNADTDWKKRDRSDFNKLYENQPIDATAYAFNMFDTLFSTSKALLRAIEEGSVQKQPEVEIEGKKLIPYTVILNKDEYIAALSKDDTTAEFSVTDARVILQNASLRGTLYVDPTINMIVQISIEATNLTQISREQSSQLGITTTHDIKATGKLNEFNRPVSILPPDQSR